MCNAVISELLDSHISHMDNLFTCELTDDAQSNLFSELPGSRIAHIPISYQYELTDNV